MNAPVYETHKRGKNWLAVIEINPRAPGGIERKFQTAARGNMYYYLADGLRVGQAVEFGADYYSGGGKKHSARWYGVITALSAEEISIVQYETADKAVEAAEELIKNALQTTSPRPTIRLMNSAMMPAPGHYHAYIVSAEEFAAKFHELRNAGCGVVSYSGYPQTAAVMSELLGYPVEVSRAYTELNDGDIMLICKLKYRIDNPAAKFGGTVENDDFEFYICEYHA